MSSTASLLQCGARRIVRAIDLPTWQDSYISLYRAFTPRRYLILLNLEFTDVSLVFPGSVAATGDPISESNPRPQAFPQEHLRV